MTGRDEPAAVGAGEALADVAAVVPAAGRSVRVGGGVNKVFRELGGRPVLAHALAALAAAGVPRAVVALRGADRPLWQERVAPWLPARMAVDLVEGGEERQDSVYAALAHLAAGSRPPRWVLVHDAARPLARPALVARVLAAARRYGAAVPAVPVGDTIKAVAAADVEPAGSTSAAAGAADEGRRPGAPAAPAAPESPQPGVPTGGSGAEPDAVPPGEGPVEWVAATLPRHRLRAVQTPQGFDFQRLWAAHQQARRHGWRGFTDDASLLERLGVPVALVPGDPANLKLTWPTDFAVAEHWLDAAASASPAAAAEGAGDPRDTGPVPSFRIGLGYDVHRFAAGRPLVLGGVPIPAERGLAGHSDADVILHAAMDALLGAAGLPDIGHWFPPGDPRWAGAASTALAAEVVALLHRHGWQPAQVDVTVVAEEPRLAPFVEAMRRSVAGALGLPPTQVGIKATTNEGLGFPGRREGIAALAVALITPRP
ncbi:2-C-methyl-D-erythritol 2,4-cyclodiphosphate synthase [Thermaerobacter sp. FW80]|uniref:2-C-methyl-D-erythritol 2,4-cyclodiphosphate synthase n=1 Tax=Thermaerobacter sp. FW80 TaxID=2546351 RepID=UPI001075450D|nr:2-C-methyl-D-erythritol 2,4-cyclodiphosphate synthase [Thermaerobacter sp. FW80]QBS37050.1 2-C-methyl-D-erythritol 2,4-cyclodiphosphate synthase [Thermaerobacter sp. FW80]